VLRAQKRDAPNCPDLKPIKNKDFSASGFSEWMAI